MKSAVTSPRARTAWVSATALALVLAGCGSSSENETEQPRDGNVGVQLFQWSWEAIAAECEAELGPAGYSWVLTSPPQEHIVGDQWWTSYQPVSYQVESRLGTREQFAAMVETCDSAGVKIIADAVINHMTGQDSPGVGWAGSEYEPYRYPGIYEPEDFHYCDTPDHDIHVYSDAYQVQFCELVNLSDLATESPHVREQIGAYLDDLLSLGVAGFRIDAAKHMPAEDVAAIVGALPEDTVIMQEVIRSAGEPIQPEDYLDSGDVFEFTWGREIQPIVGRSSIRMYFKMGETSIYAPSEQAISFVENHDTERNGEAFTYHDGASYVLANILTLAHPYGTPVVYSGYAFSERDTGAITGADGAVVDAECELPDDPASAAWVDGQWVCQHRWPAISAMVQWRNVAGDAPIVHEWDDRDALAFGRADRAFIVVNRSDEPLTGSWETGLAAGSYRDVISGATVEISGDGTLEATVAGGTALAVHVGAIAQD